MNIEVTKDSVIILENSDTPHENEYRITECHFNFDDFTNSFQVKRAIFTILSTDEMYETDIINNKCDIPVEVLKHEYEIVKLGVYGFNIDENDGLANRFSPSYAEFTVPTGSYEEGALSPETITPTQYDLYSQALQDGLNEVNDELDEIVDTVDGKIEEIDEAIENAERLDVDANKVGKITSITITKQDGTTKTVTLEDGQDGISLEDIEIDNRDLYVTYGGETENLGQVAPNIQVGTTTTGSPSSQASVINVGTDLNPILNFTIPKGEAGSIKFEIVEQLPTQDIKEDTIYLVPYTKITVQILPTENIQLHTIYIIESTGKRYVYNGNEWIEISNDNQYIEYVYINNSWEELGSIGVDINLDDYYTKTETNTLLNGKVGFTDYASTTTAGVIKGTGDYSFRVDNQGRPNANVLSYSDYSSYSTNNFISKGTLENVITGKGLVSNTDYATSSKGGVIKSRSTHGFSVADGQPYASTYDYTTYQDKANSIFISKGTLENVLTARIGDIQTLLDNLNTGNGV